MRLLIDNALSPIVAMGLRDAGHDVVHVREIGMATATDEEIFRHAASDERIVVSADTDFGTLLALRRETKPSVVLVRRQRGKKPEEQAALLVANLPAVAESLELGSIVVIEQARMRVRRLPIGTADDQPVPKA